MQMDLRKSTYVFEVTGPIKWVIGIFDHLAGWNDHFYDQISREIQEQ